MKKENNMEFSKIYKNEFVELENEKIEVVSTGNLELNKNLGIGGFPKNRLIEIYGNESSGKTTVALQAAKEVTSNKGKVLFLDFECALDPTYISKIGIDYKNFLIARPKYGEIGFSIIEEALNSKEYELIIVDSVAAMMSEDEYLTKVDDTLVLGTHARMMSKGIKKIQKSLSESGTSLIFINQIREKIGVMFGSNETTTGGRSLRYYASMRIEIRKVELIKDGTEKIGIKTKAKVVKNKLGSPFTETFINIYFGDGYDQTKDLIDYAINKHIIDKRGSWYFYEQKQLCQGTKALFILLKENQELFNKIKKECFKLLDEANS